MARRPRGHGSRGGPPKGLAILGVLHELPHLRAVRPSERPSSAGTLRGVRTALRIDARVQPAALHCGSSHEGGSGARLSMWELVLPAACAPSSKICCLSDPRKIR